LGKNRRKRAYEEWAAEEVIGKNMVRQTAILTTP